ncbi:MAG: diguanylate cyclase [Tenericutes bacterium]|nr:diguanylate cyclase [Mycoplasmatota bacterium]
MNIYLWVIYITVAVISFLPIVRLDIFSTSKKYTYFKYLSVTLFIWSLMVGLRYVVVNPVILYYMLMLMYPVVLTATLLVFLALFNYMDKRLPKILLWTLVVFIIVEVIVVLTNSSHQLFLRIGFSENITESMFREAPIGIFYYIHIMFSYALLLFSIVIIAIKLYSQMKTDKDYIPFFIFLFSIVIGISANIIHVFVYSFILDPTYVVFVLLTSVIYFVIYIRDVRLILKFDNHQFILSNLREMYLVVNHKGKAVDASKSLLNRFKIELNEGIPLDEFMDLVKNTAIVYVDPENIEDAYDESKYYIHMQKKDINMPFLKFSGHLILFYDETKVQKYIHDMDYVMNHDLMTDIYNRNFLEKIRNNYVNMDDYTIVIFDLDGLKLMNDYLGHHEGDNLLIAFADILKKIVENNQGIITIRLGGDEFLLIMKNKTKPEINKLVEQVEKEAYDEEPLKNIGFSYGIAMKKDEETFEKLLSLADINLYQMKTTRAEVKAELEKTLKNKSHIF